MKVMYIQYAGDFSEAYERLYVNGGKENYYGQAYSVGGVVAQARSGYDILVLTTITNGYKRKLEDGLTAVGIDTTTRNRRFQVFLWVRDFSPDRVILRMPDWRILMFLRIMKIPVFPVFADSFESSNGLLSRLNRLILAKELRKPCIKWISNHQINASKSLQRLGINPAKILPHDWKHNSIPADWSQRVSLDLTKKVIQIFYAGSITEKKGIFDLIKSLQFIKDMDRVALLRIAGDGEIVAVKEYAKSINVLTHINFLGQIEHENVLKEMNKADVVVVPSHHSYPEGLPMTIMESLLVHTPVIVSDHPMFVGRLEAGNSVEFFQAQKADELAKKILLICSDLDLYYNRCRSTAGDWEKLNLPLKWVEMIDKWIVDDKDPYFSEHSLLAITPHF